MSYSDFFRLCIRLFSLLGIITGFYVAVAQMSGYLSAGADAYMILLFIATVILLIVIFYALIVKSDYIIQLLRLTSGFESKEIPLQNLKAKNILEIGIVIIGLSMLIDALPDFISDSFMWVSSKIKADEQGITSFFETPAQINVGYHFLRVLIGYLLVSNFDRAATYLMPKVSNES